VGGLARCRCHPPNTAQPPASRGVVVSSALRGAVGFRVLQPSPRPSWAFPRVLLGRARLQSLAPHCPALAARTIATMPCRRASGRAGQDSTIRAKSASCAAPRAARSRETSSFSGILDVCGRLFTWRTDRLVAIRLAHLHQAADWPRVPAVAGVHTEQASPDSAAVAAAGPRCG
jgi:hypothetical protein